MTVLPYILVVIDVGVVVVVAVGVEDMDIVDAVAGVVGGAEGDVVADVAMDDVGVVGVVVEGAEDAAAVECDAVDVEA